MGLHAADCHGLRPGGSLCRTGCRICEQLGALRLYRCQRCGRVVLICSRCDCGQLYCAAGCAHKARQDSLRRAGQRYQQTPRGKRKHAARMQRYRRGQTQKVTHQAPPPSTPPVPNCSAGAFPQPAKEDPDVSLSSPPLSPCAVVLPQVQPAPGRSPRVPTASAPPAAQGAQPGCHFCGQSKSRLVRRDSLCQLRRRLAQRTARAPNPPRVPQRSPP